MALMFLRLLKGQIRRIGGWIALAGFGMVLAAFILPWLFLAFLMIPVS